MDGPHGPPTATPMLVEKACHSAVGLPLSRSSVYGLGGGHIGTRCAVRGPTALRREQSRLTGTELRQRRTRPRSCRASRRRRSGAGCRGPAASSPASVRSLSSISPSFSGLAALPRAARVDSAVLRAVLGTHVHLGGDGREARVGGDLDAAAHLEHRRVGDAGVGELVEPRLALHQRRGDCVLQAHLRLAAGRDTRAGRSAAAAAGCRARRPARLPRSDWRAASRARSRAADGSRRPQG